MFSILAASLIGVATPSFGVAVGENYFIPLDGKTIQIGSVVMSSVRVPLSGNVAFMGQAGILHSAPTAISPRIGAGIGVGVTKEFAISGSASYQYNSNGTHSAALLVTPSVSIAQNTRFNVTTGVTHNFNTTSQALIISPTISFQF